MKKVAIIYTTFMRDTLMYETVQSIIDNWQDNYTLLIGDQSKEETSFCYKTRWKMDWELEPIKKIIKYYRLPYDCGLSYARNYLVNKAHELGIKYVLITADSIKFTNKYNFQPMINFLESNPKYVKIGFNIKNKQHFTYDLDIYPKYNKFIVIKPRREPISRNNIEYTPCDICNNFCLVKTDILMEIPWDDELKLAEHEDHSLRLKQAGYKTFYTDVIEAEYINDKPDEYKQMRNRLYSKFKNILKLKYGLNPDGSWLVYNHKLPLKDQIK